MAADCLIAPNSGIVVYVTRLGTTHHGLQEQVGPCLPHRPYGYLKLTSMKWVARLKPNNTAPAEFGGCSSHLQGCQAKLFEVKMKGHLESFNPTSNIMTACVMKKVVNCRMRDVCCAVDRLRLSLFVNKPNFLHMHHG